MMEKTMSGIRRCLCGCLPSLAKKRRASPFTPVPTPRLQLGNVAAVCEDEREDAEGAPRLTCADGPAGSGCSNAKDGGGSAAQPTAVPRRTHGWGARRGNTRRDSFSELPRRDCKEDVGHACEDEQRCSLLQRGRDQAPAQERVAMQSRGSARPRASSTPVLRTSMHLL